MFLVIDSSPETLLAHRRMLYANRILSVSSDYRNLPSADSIANLDGVILSNPYDRHMPVHFPYQCHTHFPRTPIIGFTQALRQTPADIGGYDIQISLDLTPHKMIDSLLLETSRYHGRDIADCMAGRARDHILMQDPTWCGSPLPMTRAERMIYRYLILAYPRLVSAKELLRYCMKPGTSPQHCNIATHIYHINQKAKLDDFDVPVIHCPGGIGYQIVPYTPPSSKSNL